MQNGYGHAAYDSEKKRNGRLPPTDTSSETWKQENDNDFPSKFRERSMTSVKKNSETTLLRTFPSSVSRQDANAKANSVVATFLQESSSPSSHEVIPKYEHKRIGKKPVKSDSANSLGYHATQATELREDNDQTHDPLASMVSAEEKKKPDDHIIEEMAYSPENKLIQHVSEDAFGGQATGMSEKAPEVPLPSSMKAQNVRSVRKHGLVEGTEDIYAGENELNPDIIYASQKKAGLGVVIEPKTELPDFRDESKTRIELPYASKNKGEHGVAIEPTTELPDCRDEWKTTIQMLREELREAAATEVGLYSIVAEHASSVNKVHTPARRLSRFYIDACKGGSQAKRASAARAAVSGLVLVSKSCGHDVPR